MLPLRVVGVAEFRSPTSVAESLQLLADPNVNYVDLTGLVGTRMLRILQGLTSRLHPGVTTFGLHAPECGPVHIGGGTTSEQLCSKLLQWARSAVGPCTPTWECTTVVVSAGRRRPGLTRDASAAPGNRVYVYTSPADTQDHEVRVDDTHCGDMWVEERCGSCVLGPLPPSVAIPGHGRWKTWRNPHMWGIFDALLALWPRTNLDSAQCMLVSSSVA